MQTILVTDDDETLCRNVSLALETEGFQVLSAMTLKEAAALWESADLILLDMLLPDGCGMELCMEIRKVSAKPVLFLTSCDEEADIIKGLDSGADDYITKPFRLRELLSRIRANLRRCASAEELELTAIEQKLLDYLMLNRGQYLTREQLLHCLWDCKGVFVNDNTLSVNISRLREKLKASGHGQITTKRGLGYKWTE